MREAIQRTLIILAQEAILMNNQTPLKKSLLPIIALVFGFVPIIFLLLSRIPYIGIFFGYLFFITWFGIYFQFIGVILGIIVLYKIKYNNVIDIIFSIVAISSPIIWCCVLFYLDKFTSMEIWI